MIPVLQDVFYDYLSSQVGILKEVNRLLATQLEFSKVEEQKEALAFQIIDRAVPPFRRYSPHRVLISLTAFFFSAFFCVLIAFVWDNYVESSG